jgi:hypothetical protein
LEDKNTVRVASTIEDQGPSEASRGIIVVDCRREDSTTEILAGQIIGCQKRKSSGHAIGICCIILSNLGNGIVVLDDSVDDSRWKTSD